MRMLVTQRAYCVVLFVFFFCSFFFMDHFLLSHPILSAIQYIYILESMPMLNKGSYNKLCMRSIFSHCLHVRGRLCVANSRKVKDSNTRQSILLIVCKRNNNEKNKKAPLSPQTQKGWKLLSCSRIHATDTQIRLAVYLTLRTSKVFKPGPCPGLRNTNKIETIFPFCKVENSRNIICFIFLLSFC